jgi:2-desacetyl-2-hydroxyethyl bacteriochlorophyllide A dehydrogenase
MQPHLLLVDKTKVWFVWRTSWKEPARMPTVVEFVAPGEVRLVEEDRAALPAGSVRVRTTYSGISAGTELTAYRGSNPYLSKTWDAERRLFVPGEPAFGYPVRGWGYSEVGIVTEIGDGVAARSSIAVGDVVWGIWGHRSEAVIEAAKFHRHRLPEHVDPVSGVFARVGAIALNAVLASRPAVGATVAIFGQGVIGLLATALAARSGMRVIAVDLARERRAMARELGAEVVLDPADAGPDGVAATMRGGDFGPGPDVAIELSGSYRGLSEAIRSVRLEGTVVAAGFYQGEADGLRLGEEFHHNRVTIIASQIGGTPRDLAGSWDQERLQTTFMDQVVSGAIDPQRLVSRRFAAADVADAFALLDKGSEALQVVLDFSGAGDAAHA